MGQGFSIQGHEKKAKGKQEEDKLFTLEESLRAIDGVKAYGSIDPIELYLVLSITVPKKFKVSKLKKYSSFSNSKTHIIRYYREMTEVAHNKKLLMHFFHNSLIGVVLRSYTQLHSS